MQPQNKPPETEWTVRGFNQRFDEFVKDGNNYVQSYIKTEEEHVELFGHIRFKNYESFRSSRKNFLFPNTQ